MSKSWSESAAVYLQRADTCPRCDAVLVQPGRCSNCNAKLSGAQATRVAAVSKVAAEAILARQVAIDALASFPATVAVAAIVPAAPTVAAPASASANPLAQPGEGSQISVQSILAVVGAALLGVAAIVFTFLNPDLTTFATRTTIIGVTTGVFLIGAFFLMRARLRFSAEAIGALGMVFLALDVWAFSHGAPHSVSPYVFAGIGTAVSAIGLIAIGAFVRLRTWLWLGLVGLAVSPVWFGFAIHHNWAIVAGFLAIGFVGLGAHEIARFLGSRMTSRLRADHWGLTSLQLLVVAIVIVGGPFYFATYAIWWLPSMYAVIALLAIVSCRNELPAFWSLASGATLATAAAVLINSQPATWFAGSGWVNPSDQFGIAAIVVILAALSRIRVASDHHRVSRLTLLIGALAVLLYGFLYELTDGASFYFIGLHALPAPAWTWGLGLSLGMLVTALGVFGIWAIGPRRIMPRFAFAMVVVAEAIAGVALLTLAGWDELHTWTQVLVALALAAGLGLTLAFVPAVRAAKPSLRVPALVTVHALVIEAAAIAWTDPLLSQIGGAAIVISWIAVTIAMPRVIRPVYAAVGFAYGLIVFAHVLQLAHLSDVAILSVTAALASAVAILVTLVRRVRAGYWYGVLIVSAVPFVIGVGDVLFLRSGWTGLSTGVTFVLALTLVLTTRPGLSQYLRAVAAALLVPALAVVVVDLGAQYLRQSASPITLPAIAIIVACVLPSTNLIGAALVRRGHSETDARLSRLWIEISTLVTAGLAVVLALVRAAAGLNTSFLVLIIVGVGAAATALVTHRRYGWIVAFASWTGALWSFWGIHGVNVVEPYLLPPAIAAALIGAISVLRKLPGVGLYAVGLVCAVVPSLAVLAVSGNHDSVPWRLIGLVGGSFALVVLGGVFASRPAQSRVRPLAAPSLLVGVLAASGAAVEAVRVGHNLDLLWLHHHDPVMFVVLELSVVAAALGVLGARMISTADRRASGRWRWLYMPAVLYLAIGPIVAVRPGWLSVWTLLALTIALLALLVATVTVARKHPVALPPVWFTFAVAWCVAVAGWSIRSLRVEAFSLPLGIALVLVGILAMRTPAPSDARRSLNTWPLGYAGSWRLLTPGIVVTFVPSILATGTDPQTARAILVIAMALLAILIGSLRRLGAPFILGIVVLPLEIITVFAAQIGHTISATSWWITLATAGAVLLLIAVTYERRTSGERGVAARLRDLR